MKDKIIDSEGNETNLEVVYKYRYMFCEGPPTITRYSFSQNSGLTEENLNFLGDGNFYAHERLVMKRKGIIGKPKIVGREFILPEGEIPKGVSAVVINLDDSKFSLLEGEEGFHRAAQFARLVGHNP